MNENEALALARQVPTVTKMFQAWEMAQTVCDSECTEAIVELFFSELQRSPDNWSESERRAVILAKCGQALGKLGSPHSKRLIAALGKGELQAPKFVQHCDAEYILAALQNSQDPLVVSRFQELIAGKVPELFGYFQLGNHQNSEGMFNTERYIVAVLAKDGSEKSKGVIRELLQTHLEQDEVINMPELCETLVELQDRESLPFIQQAEKAVRTGECRARIQKCLQMLNSTQASVGGEAGKVAFVCSACGAKLKVPAARAGRSGSCPKCRGRIQAPPLEPPFEQVAAFGENYLGMVVRLKIRRGYGDPIISRSDSQYHLYAGLDPDHPQDGSSQVGIRAERNSEIDRQVFSMPEMSDACFTGIVCEDQRVENKFAVSVTKIEPE